MSPVDADRLGSCLLRCGGDGQRELIDQSQQLAFKSNEPAGLIGEPVIPPGPTPSP